MDVPQVWELQVSLLAVVQLGYQIVHQYAGTPYHTVVEVSQSIFWRVCCARGSAEKKTKKKNKCWWAFFTKSDPLLCGLRQEIETGHFISHLLLFDAQFS